jgi:hypothetical protein
LERAPFSPETGFAPMQGESHPVKNVRRFPFYDCFGGGFCGMFRVRNFAFLRKKIML